MLVSLKLIQEYHMIGQDWGNDFSLAFAFRYSQHHQHRP